MLTNGGKLDGRYLIEREIGSGGFGAVFLATDTRFSGNNQVAIKQILLNTEQAAKLFRQEADLLYNLSHPNLPKVTNCFEENAANFIVMDYISGEDLAESLKKGRRFTIEECLDIADRVLDALEYLHSFLIYHRDIKPHNIKIDKSGKIYLLDFGTAKGSLEKTNPPMQFGQSITGFTPFYAPLEQVLRVDPSSFLMLQSLASPHLEEFIHRKTDERSDIYSLGATLYHILTAQSPERATATVRAFTVWSGKSDPLPICSEINPEISPALAEFIHRSLEIEPEKRFQKAAEMRQALRKLSAEPAPPISDLTTIAQSSESNPSFDLSNPSRQPTAIFQYQAAAATSEPQIKSLVTAGGKPRIEPEMPPTFDPDPVAAPPEIRDQTFAPASEKSAAAPSVSSKSKLLIYFGAVCTFLVLCALGGGWLASRRSSESPSKKIETAKNETAALPAPPKNIRSLSYFLTVQKMRNQKPFQEPFQSSGQEIFENDYRFQMHFALPDDGYFYAFAEGLDEQGVTVLKIQFPTPKSNNGSAAVTAKRQYSTSPSKFDGKPGTETFWILWSREKSEIAETARADAFENAGSVSDAGVRNRLKLFLETAARNQTEVSKETDKKITEVEFNGDAVAQMIQLEHR